MQTPKEKAQELYNKFKEALAITSDMRAGSNPFVIMCCLITVNDHLKHGTPNPFDKEGNEQRFYWQNVKSEIENYTV